MFFACSALFGHILKEVRVFCFPSYVGSKKNFKQLDVQTRIQTFSVQSLQEGVLEFEIFTTDTRMLRVKSNPRHYRQPYSVFTGAEIKATESGVK